MTTATDWNEATWTDTGEHATVTDVKAALAATEPTERERTLLARIDGLATENDRLRAELGRWTPRRDWRAITGAADLTERQRGTALVAPTAEDLAETDRDGMPLTPMLAQYEWPTWLGDVHHADKAVAQAVEDLRAWPEQYAARPVERTVVEPVQVRRDYRSSEAWLWAEMVVSQSRQREEYGGHVYDKDEGFVTVEADVPADDRVERMIEDPEAYFAEARERAEREVREQFDRDQALDKLKRRVQTAITAPPTRRVAGQPPTYNETAAELAEPDGWVPATWWARALAWISGRKRGL